MSNRWRGAETVGDPLRGSSVPRYLLAVLARHARWWLAVGLVGLLAGLGATTIPQADKASTRLLLTHRQDQDPELAILTDVRMASSRPVAERVVTRLDLPWTTNKLLKRYRVRAVSDRVLELTVTADSPAAATRIARALGTAVLEYRIEQARTQQRPLLRRLEAAQTGLERLRRNAATTSEELEAERKRIAGMQHLVALETAELRRMEESKVLDRAAPVVHPEAKALASDAGYGLVGGLAAGLLLVTLRAVFTGPLWQPRTISRALGAPVTASVGRVRGQDRWQRVRRRLPWPSGADWLEVAVDDLYETVERQRPAKPTLLVVPVGCARASALVVATLAVRYAEHGGRTLVADLTRRGLLAGQLGVTAPGTSRSPLPETDGRVVVHLPGPGDTGHGRLEPDDDQPVGYDPLRIEWAVADVVLTLVDATPGDRDPRPRSWAPRAVAMVSASWTGASRLRATADLVRHAGVELESVMLVDAHRLDRLGAEPDRRRRAPAAERATASLPG